ITVDANEHIVKPKYASAPKDTSLNAQPSPRGMKRLLEQEHSSPRSSGPPIDDGHVQPANNRRAAPLNCPPLRRTDSQTILDGMRLEYPNYSTLREATHPVTTASAPAESSTPPRNPSPLRRTDSQTVLDGRRLMYPNHSIPHGPTHPTNTASTPTRSSSAASRGKAPSNPQSISRPQDPRADSGSTRQGSGHSLHPVSSTQSSSTSVRPAPPPTRPAPAARRNGPASATPRNRQGPTPPPQGAPNPADSHTGAQCNVAQNKEGHPMPPVEDEAGEPVGLGGEEGPPEASAFKKKQVRGKVTIKSFPEEEQPVIHEMAKVARARIIANGAYDDTTREIARYEPWPEEWTPRLPRNIIVAQCLKTACDEFCMPLVNSLITTHRSLVIDEVKSLVERHFKFTLEQSQRNINLCKALLPFNFHFRDIANKRGSFENPIIIAACQAVAFGKASTVGARFPEFFKATPPPFLAYVCALVHGVVWAYRSGEHNREHLNHSVQTEAFRRALRFLIEMQDHQRNKMHALRGAVFRTCMEGLEPKDKAHDPTPEIEREWTPDIEEVHTSDDEDKEDRRYMDDEGVAGNTVNNNRAQPRAQSYVRIGRQGAGPSAMPGDDDRMEIDELDDDGE
ncbi:hypothetical protein FRC06_009126, partial [Ceratobasidium sp. 370]